jgi:rhodanese-related sulfurtransferase
MSPHPSSIRPLIEAGSIAVLALVLSLAYNSFSSHGIELIGKERKLPSSADTTQRQAAKDTPRPRLIDFDEAYRLYEEGNALFADARHEDDFAMGHIKGAILLPLSRLEENPQLLKGVPKDKVIVTYCGGVDCALSIDVGEKLAALGYTNVLVYFAGWLDWQQKNLPIETGLKENMSAQ